MPAPSGSIATRILIIEDEGSVARFLKNTLQSHGYEERTADTGVSGLQAAIEFRPDLIVLDLGLPDIDGHTVLARLREWCRAPILILTARETDEDKVRALDSGADDYLTKPFSTAELLARIRVALRHAHRTEDHQEDFQLGELAVNLGKKKVTVSGKTVRLTSTEFDILGVLVKHVGRVVTHRALLKEVWGPNSTEHTQYLRVYIGQLRKKIGSNFIVTDPGIGYRLTHDEERDS
jgi:two-component system, OmpR family, KDP operon response regulator KdpE